MKTTFKALRSLDWTLAVGTLAVGAYLQEPLIAGAGALGLLVAWYNPAERVKGALQKRFIRKTAVRSDSGTVSTDDTFYAADAPEPGDSAAGPETLLTPRSYSDPMKAGQLYLNSSPHNALRVDYLRFSVDDTPRPWA
jgi:hypothetical protein